MMLFEPVVQERLARSFPLYSMVVQSCLDSTNVECQRLWQAQPDHHWLVLADEQTHGRGRYGRKWDSAPGVNLYLSLVWDNCFGYRVGHLNLFLGLMVWEALTALYGTLDRRLTLKWPNDVYVGQKKLAGILIQNLDPGLRQLVVGIGINVYGQPCHIPDTATSLLMECPQLLGNQARADILRQFLLNLDTAAVVYQKDPPRILDAFWEAASLTRVQSYSYHSLPTPAKGVLHALHPDGTVDLLTATGEVLHLTS
jgi:BirA family biotin operon repressor/biotin-[acetyl-CoA-carboxylase] ligase